MSWSVVIPITNPGASAQKVTIPKGTLIQVNSDKYQNVVLADTVVVTIPPNQTIRVKVEAYCANQRLASPNAVPANLTKWTLPRHFTSQGHVWGMLNEPAVPPNPSLMNTVVPGVSLEKVISAIRNAYSDKALEQMLKLRLNFDLYGKIARGSFEEVTFDLLEKSRKEGWQKELIREAYRYNADQDPKKLGNADLREVYAAFGF